jgi:hypothetical protein
MHTIQLFFSAVLGSLIVEVHRAYNGFQSGKRELPKRYRQASFYIVCLLCGLAAGCLATLLPCQTVLQALGVGAVAPRVVAKLVKKAALLFGDL